MTTKLPQGVAVRIRTHRSTQFVNNRTLAGVPNGLAFTFDQLADRDKAIARAAYIQGHRQGFKRIDSETSAADDYLASPEYKTLTGRG